METKNLFAKNLKYLRLKKGISQDSLASMLGYKSFSSIQKWEDGSSQPNLGIVSEISKILNVTMDDLANVDIELKQKAGHSNEMEFIYCPYINDIDKNKIPDNDEGMENLPKMKIPVSLLGENAYSDDFILINYYGESLNNIIKSGSWIGVIINIDVDSLKDGDITLFKSNNTYLVMKYYNLGNEILLRPDSSDLSYSDIRLKKDDRIMIVGKVIMYHNVLH